MASKIEEETKKYVTFELDNEAFALEIEKVREVLDFTTVTPVPQTPEFMRGVINLRGLVVPVIDLRKKFGMSKTENTVDTRIVIVEIKVDGETTVLGSLADSVREVVELDQSHIGPAPKIGTQLRTDFIKGMGKKDGEFIIILDIDQVFSDDEISQVRQSEGTPGAGLTGAEKTAAAESSQAGT